MAVVNEREDFVLPFLAVHALLGPDAFAESCTRSSVAEGLAKLRLSRLVDEATLARALRHLPAREDRPEFIGVTLKRELSRCLVLDGARWTLAPDLVDPGRETRLWRATSLLVPPSLVVAAACASSGRRGPPGVTVLPDTLAPSSPVHRTHVHLGPLLPFEDLWGALARHYILNGTLSTDRSESIARESPPSIRVPSIARVRRRPGLAWLQVLEMGFAARVWLADRLDGPTEEPPSWLVRFARGSVRSGDRQRPFASPLMCRARRKVRNELRTSLASLPRGRTTSATPRSGYGGDAEIELIAKGLLHPAVGTLDWAARVLYQYLRVKIALYRHLLVDPWSTGLRHFLEVVRRDGVYSDLRREESLANRIHALAFQPPLRIASAEVHCTPRWWLANACPYGAPFDQLASRRVVEQCRARRPSARGVESVGDDARPSGWLLSFSRVADEKRFYTDPGRAWRLKAGDVAWQCRMLEARFRACPQALRSAPAIGLMDLESNGPVWLFAMSIKRLLAASRVASALDPRRQLAPLRTAFHLGEDFQHLLSGLRAIHEAFEWGLVSRGDRVGHALALGLDPCVWQARHGCVRLSLWERFLDVGYLYWLATSAGRFEFPLLMEQYREVARDCLQRMLGREYPGFDLRWDPLAIARETWLELPRARTRGGGSRAFTRDRLIPDGTALIDRVLYDRNFGRRALLQGVSVDTAADLAALRLVQQVVAATVAHAGVAIEVNPSSNLLIGGFSAMFEQPTFHANDLPMTIDADDPLTFGTSLPEEYAYAWAGMVAAGVPPARATERIEQAAVTSRRFAFIR